MPTDEILTFCLIPSVDCSREIPTDELIYELAAVNQVSQALNRLLRGEINESDYLDIVEDAEYDVDDYIRIGLSNLDRFTEQLQGLWVPE